MNKYIRFAGMLLILLHLIGCEDDKKQLMSVDVNFKITYGGEPLVMFEDYKYPTGESMLFSRFSFFLSDLQLKGNDDYLLKSIDYLNFTNPNSTLEGAKEGITLSFADVDKLDYEKLNFKIGVNALDNAKTPASFASSNPLSKAGEYWPSWESYIFTRTEGQIMIDNKTVNYSLHTGKDNALLSVDLPLSDFNTSNTRKIEVVIDLKDYYGSTQIYDIKSNPQIHSPEQEPQVLELTKNLAESIKYRVE